MGPNSIGLMSLGKGESLIQRHVPPKKKVSIKDGREKNIIAYRALSLYIVNPSSVPYDPLRVLYDPDYRTSSKP